MDKGENGHWEMEHFAIIWARKEPQDLPESNVHWELLFIS